MQEKTKKLLEGYPISGLANCHLPGIYSLVFAERVSEAEGMVRVFAVPDTDVLYGVYRLEGPPEFAVLPHNHRQDITLTLLKGKASNVKFFIGDGRSKAWEYRFGSALLNGEFTLERVRQVDYIFVEVPLDGYMSASEVHTVMASQGAAWVVEEGQRVVRPPSLCYSHEPHKKLDNTGLYVKLTDEKLKRVWDKIRQQE